MPDEKKHTVDEKIAVLMVSNDDKSNVIEYRTFIDKVEDLFKQNSFKAYDKFNVTLAKDKDFGYGLLFTGTRNETKEEQTQREGAEGARRKQLEDAELKEYLRLHKKYGKH